MERLDKLIPLRDVINRYGLTAKKSLGQHFLLDRNLNDRIVNRALGKNVDLSNYTIIEIGPGPGGLTRSILECNPRELIAIEKDTRCIKAISDLKAEYKNKLVIKQSNALNINLSELGTKPIQIIANLPYNIGAPLLIKWLKQAHHINQMTLMFQKEVVDRLIAKPSSKAYGRLSVITQWLCHTKFEFDINSRAFTPPPNVTSSLITLKPRPNITSKPKFENMEKVTAAAFGQRRKMLRTSLKSLDINMIALGINPKLRAENLTVEEYVSLANAIEEK
ncbi:MAG: 16S rRNA (adenine(1518)-N(6)/adenine(1519)-N(6))-dimethyltransferase [Rhodospirillaceae bacterium]|nr:16S rRNA (adenine(1518)-N(6)/adenine(1519)-N(6))-dimethyltransferase [Rhodospirillaceae bacterium]OUT78416.1 MAG: 16S rRNA (adenine(1518)-N(6)/adenine(1519)-N(6))-dimethyltransferase [Rhodospirillaceae bacterium TMED23]